MVIPRFISLIWADNLEAIKLLLTKGAKTTLKAKDGLTPYAKAKEEGRQTS